VSVDVTGILQYKHINKIKQSNCSFNSKITVAVFKQLDWNFYRQKRRKTNKQQVRNCIPTLVVKKVKTNQQFQPRVKRNSALHVGHKPDAACEHNKNI